MPYNALSEIGGLQAKMLEVIKSIKEERPDYDQKWLERAEAQLDLGLMALIQSINKK